MPTAIRITAIVIEVVFLLWFIIPIRFRIFKAGNILGVLMCSAAIFRTAFSPAYHALGGVMAQNAVTNILWIILRIGCIAFAVYAILISVCMIIAMKRKPSSCATAIILGAQVKPWGASRLLKQRIFAAERYLHEHPDAVAIASGGQGANEPMAEADCILQWMVDDGFSPDRILTENRSVNTEQNLRFSLPLIKEHNLPDDLAIISDSYHQLRARIIAHKIDRSLHIGAVNTKNTKFGVLVYPSYFVREWIAIPVELIKKPGRPAVHHKI